MIFFCLNKLIVSLEKVSLELNEVTDVKGAFTVFP